MKTHYATLFQCDLRHTYYDDGQARNIIVEPTPGCRRLLAQYDLVFRPERGLFSVFARVDPDTDPPALFHRFGSDAVAFRFCLRLGSPYFHHITTLPEHDGMRTVFYLDNLRDDQAGGRRYLGDSVTDHRLAPPIQCVFEETYDFAFQTPVSEAEIVVRDVFGRVHLTDVLTDTSQSVATHRLNLRTLPRPGRYEITDDHGEAESIYYDPTIHGRDIFGIVDIYNRTDLLTLDGSDRVPAPYRFLNGNEVTGQGRYTIGFEARSTVRRYIVTKKYDTNGIRLDDLGIAGGVSFNSTREAERVIFTSDGEVPLAEAPDPLTLEDSDTPLRNLPHPRMNTPLQRATPTDPYRSDLYVYI